MIPRVCEIIPPIDIPIKSKNVMLFCFKMPIISSQNLSMVISSSGTSDFPIPLKKKIKKN